jgi:hypothetical protein
VFKGYIRLSLIAIWAALFISYFGVFAARLQDWNDDVPQHCYLTSKISRPGDPHPRVDKTYAGITFAFTLSTLCISTVYALQSKSGRRTTHVTILALSEEQRRWFTQFTADRDLEPNSTGATAKFSWHDAWQLTRQLFVNRDLIAWQLQDLVIRVALFQCPLHIYSIFALRSSNEGFLDEGSTERDWGFGQIVAMVLLGAVVLTVADGVTGKLAELLGCASLMKIDFVERGDGRGKKVMVSGFGQSIEEGIKG